MPQNKKWQPTYTADRPPIQICLREGRAVVFESLQDLAARIDSSDLDVRADDFLELKNAGPLVLLPRRKQGYLPIPQARESRRR